MDPAVIANNTLPIKHQTPNCPLMRGNFNSNLGGDVLPKSIEAVKPLGVVMVFGFTAGPETTFDVRSLFFAQKKLRSVMASDIEDLERGLEQVKAGKIKLLLDTVLLLSQAGAAHQLLAESRVKGNIVLQPWAA